MAKRTAKAADLDYYVRIPDKDPTAAPPRMAVKFVCFGRTFQAGDAWFGPMKQADAETYSEVMLHPTYAPVFELAAIEKGKSPTQAVIQAGKADLPSHRKVIALKSEEDQAGVASADADDPVPTSDSKAPEKAPEEEEETTLTDDDDTITLEDDEVMLEDPEATESE